MRTTQLYRSNAIRAYEVRVWCACCVMDRALISTQSEHDPDHVVQRVCAHVIERRSTVAHLKIGSLEDPERSWPSYRTGSLEGDPPERVSSTPWGWLGSDFFIRG